MFGVRVLISGVRARWGRRDLRRPTLNKLREERTGYVAEIQQEGVNTVELNNMLRMQQRFDEMADVLDLDHTIAQQMNRWMRDQRGDLIRLLDTIDDPEERKHMYAATWVRLKSQWVVYNTQIGYEIAKTGEAKADTLVKAATVAIFVDAIEPFVERHEVERVTAHVGSSWHDAA